MAPIIRGLRPSDRPRLIAALESDATFSETEVDVALELVDNALENGERDYTVRVADLEDFAVAGYICYGHTPMTDSTWDLYWLVTHARARGHGVAAALITAMEVELRAAGATAVRVETSQQESHGPARRLYDRLGYPITARLTDFYRAGDDLIIYFKKL